MLFRVRVHSHWMQLKQDCIPVGCVPPARWPYLPACSAPGGGLLWGGCLLRGCLVLGGIPACSEADPPSVNRILDTRLWKYYLAPKLRLWAVNITENFVSHHEKCTSYLCAWKLVINTVAWAFWGWLPVLTWEIQNLRRAFKWNTCAFKSEGGPTLPGSACVLCHVLIGHETLTRCKKNNKKNLPMNCDAKSCTMTGIVNKK